MLRYDYRAMSAPVVGEGVALPQATTRTTAAPRWLPQIDTTVSYQPENMVLLFFCFCGVGWLWEVLVDIVRLGELVNRGTLYGPWLPLYGFCGVALLLLMRRVMHRPLVTFGLVFLVCGVIEYFTSLVLEYATGSLWWDYSEYMFNIDGRVCLLGLLFFAAAGFACIYLLGPVLDKRISRLGRPVRIALCVALVALFLIDLAYSVGSPNTAAAIAVAPRV